MRDQAAELRQLVLRSIQQDATGDGAAPRLLLVAGGKGGVGTTTLAVNVSVAMALNGSRVVLADADLYRADVAPLCGLTEQGSVADVLTARRDIHEVIQPGPAGVQVVPGLWAPGGTTELSEVRQHRLIQQLRSLRRHADVVVVDVGNGSSEIVRRFWEAADEAILVTTPDSVAVMDSYATIKTMSDGASTPIRLIVNQVAGMDEATDVHQRIDQSCHRFLQLEIGWLGYVVNDSSVTESANNGRPIVIQSPDSAAAKQIQEISSILCNENDGTSSSQRGKAA